VLKKIAIDQFSELVKALAEKGPLYAPVKGRKALISRRLKIRPM